ncbi:MAG: hypothetical protein V4630_10950 [Pseudomonadota bacterium]|jgi:hypothetical protein|uniref:hypothetical protein n=1 Tax=Tabrizicola sp. TaxID=2005166 RepID=UPI0025F315C9|nr:hypothetical protein [Tabrizicola sp.]
MRRILCLAPFLVPTAALAEAFQRPIPQPQTAEAELAYLTASLIFLAALIAVQWLVSRR